MPAEGGGKSITYYTVAVHFVQPCPLLSALLRTFLKLTFVLATFRSSVLKPYLGDGENENVKCVTYDGLIASH